MEILQEVDDWQPQPYEVAVQVRGVEEDGWRCVRASYSRVHALEGGLGEAMFQWRCRQRHLNRRTQGIVALFIAFVADLLLVFCGARVAVATGAGIGSEINPPVSATNLTVKSKVPFLPADLVTRATLRSMASRSSRLARETLASPRYSSVVLKISRARRPLSSS